MANFYNIVDKTFKFEGGFQQFANDTANYCDGQLIGTNRGISAIAYKGYYGKCPTVDEMKALTEQQAKAIYKKNFWDYISGDNIKDESVAHIMFDAHIASGGAGVKRIKTAINKIKKIFPVVDTSRITSVQANEINSLNQKQVFDVIKQGEIDNRNYLYSINPDKYGKFIKGWLNRLNQITYDGLSTIKNNPITTVLIIVGLSSLLFFIFNYKTILNA